MKRYFAAIVTAILLLSLLVCGVSAESTFKFREISRKLDQELLWIEWNAAEGNAAGVTDIVVKFNGMSYSTHQDADAPTIIFVDVSDLSAGEHEVKVVYRLNGKQEFATLSPFTMKEDEVVFITLSVNASGNPVAEVKTRNGQAIKGYKVKVEYAGVNYNGTTNASGICKLPIQLNVGDTVSCWGEEQAIGAVTYASTDKVQATFEKKATTTTQAPTTTTQTEETTTTLEGEETTTTLEGEETTTTQKPQTTTTTKQPTMDANATTAQQTYATIRGAATTAQKDGRIALNVSLDENILTLFGCKKNDFANKARLLLTKDDYNNLTGRSSYQLMLNVLTAPEEPSAAQINAAVAGVSKFSTYSEDSRKAVTFDLSFLKINSNTGENVPVSALPINSTYIVQLPVPAEMRGCEKLAITMFNGDSLMEPMEVEVQGGTFAVTINSLEAYTLIGFGGEEDNAQGGSNSWLLIGLLILGILLLAAAAVLVFFFVLRKPAPKKPAPAFVPKSFDENDIFSGRDDI